MKNKKDSVLWHWLRSYMIVLLIPLMAIFINHTINVNTIEKGLMHANELINHNLKSNIDNYLYDEKELYKYVFANDDFQAIKSSRSKNAQFYYKVSKLCQQIKNYCGINEGIDCLVYLKEKDYVISSQSANESSYFYSALKLEFGEIEAYEAWKDFLAADYEESFFVGSGVTQKTSEPCLIFANTLLKTKENSVNIFVSIPMAKFSNFLESMPEKTYFHIAVGDQLVVFDKEGNYSVLEAGDTEALSQFFDAEACLYTTEESNESNMVYSLITTKESLNQSMSATDRSFGINILVTVVMSVAGVLLFVNLNYRPVGKLLKHVGVDEAKENEFREMEKGFENSRQTISDQQQELFNSYLLSLMKGRTSGLSELQGQDFFHITKDTEVALVGFMIPSDDRQNIKYDELLFFAVDNIFCELTSLYKSYRVEDGHFIFYLSEVPDGNMESWKNCVLNQAEYICDLFKEKWGRKITGVVSDRSCKINHIKFLYRDCMETFDLQNMLGGNVVISTGMISEKEHTSYVWESIREELCDAVKVGNYNDALEASSQMFQYQRNYSFTTQQMCAFEAFKMVLEIYQSYAVDSVQYVQALEYVKALMKAVDAESLKNCFHEILKYVCADIETKWKMEGRVIISRILEYIAGHYADQELNVNSIAEALDRNPRYLARVFKEETGNGLLDYINEYRIGKAKEVLVSNKYTLEEISVMVGYPNVRAFRRNFAKINGITPSEYRKGVK